jgi:RHS repeat-associated protein
LYPEFVSTLEREPESAQVLSSMEEYQPIGDCDSMVYEVYGYHPNYLGSVDLVSTLSGHVHPFFMYTPWGESMYEYSAQTTLGPFDSPFRFNDNRGGSTASDEGCARSAELDKETGYSYYGARYYQSKLSMWLSVDPKAHWFPAQSPYNFSLNNPVNLEDPNGKWVKGAGFWNNIFYSDKRNTAMMKAGKDGSYEKTDQGWNVTRTIPNSSSDNTGGNEGILLDEVVVICLKDDGKRSLDDWGANFVRALGNALLITLSAIVDPFVALGLNSIRENGDPYYSANPIMFAEDEGIKQMHGSTQEIGKETMKATIGLLLLGTPATQFWKGQGATTVTGEFINEGIDNLEGD